MRDVTEMDQHEAEPVNRANWCQLSACIRRLERLRSAG